MTRDLSLSVKSDILLLTEDGKDFLDYLRGFSARQGTVSHAEFRTERKELEAAEIANRIANALATIDDIVRSKLPRYICDELNVADGVLHRLADRWGWDQVIGAGGDEFICSCIKEREAINRQYHAKMEEAGIRAVVSYVQLSKERPDISLLDRAGPAMIVGTKPTMSLGEAEDSMADLKKALESPCVGKAWPTCTLAEVRVFELSIRKIEEWIRDGAANDSRRNHDTIMAELSELSIRKIEEWIRDGAANASVRNLDAIMADLSTDRSGTPGTPPQTLKSKSDQAHLPLSRELAFNQYLSAVKELGDKATDREAFEWLHERDEIESGLSFGSWSRYLRYARRLLDQNKNRPRRGRKSRSIVDQAGESAYSGQETD